MEGHRFFDLQHYGNGTDYMADMLNACILHENTIPGTISFKWLAENSPQAKMKCILFPAQIDLSVVNGGPKLKQNPNY